ncbi:MAG: acyl-CoA synthetase [Elstera sp.]
MKFVPDLCHQRAKMSPDAPAFIDPQQHRAWSFAEVDRRVGRGAAWLLAAGVQEGDRVAVLCYNSVAFFELLFAAARAKLILVPLNWRQTPAELRPILADCAPSLLFHDAANADLAAAVTDGTGIPTHSFTAWDAACASSGTPLSPTPWESDRPWYLLYTSGTTGKPKAVIQTVSMALANMINVQIPTGMGPETRALNFMPLFHTAGINLYTLPVFLVGGVSQVLPKFDVETVLELMQQGAVTVFFAVPAIYRAISLHPQFETIDFSSVKSWGCGGAPISASLIEIFLKRGITICNGMGMTETGPTIFFMDRAHAPLKIGAVGKPQLLAEVCLMGPDGRPVPDGADGELWFRGPGITPGYYNNPTATQDAFAPGGWLKSGDIGRCDSDGYYTIVDRIKDMYISGGENVYPAEVEALLQRHPAVLEAAVVGVPDAQWGEVGHAAVILRPGHSASPEQLQQYARAALAPYKVPKRILLLTDFPRTAAGKVQKHLLRAVLTEPHTPESA